MSYENGKHLVMIEQSEMLTVGGTATQINEYPSMAGVVDAMERRIICGATISEF